MCSMFPRQHVYILFQRINNNLICLHILGILEDPKNMYTYEIIVDKKMRSFIARVRGTRMFQGYVRLLHFISIVGSSFLVAKVELKDNR